MKQLVLALFLVSASLTAHAETFGDGLAAYSLQDYQRAYEIWRPMAEAGDARAQYHLAQLFDYGRGVLADDAKAADWYRRAAEAGYPAAGYHLGAALMAAGQPEQARPWLERSAAAGEPRAQYSLAALLMRGGASRPDFPAALGWLDKAIAGLPAGPQRKLALAARAQVRARLAARTK